MLHREGQSVRAACRPRIAHGRHYYRDFRHRHRCAVPASATGFRRRCQSAWLDSSKCSLRSWHANQEWHRPAERAIGDPPAINFLVNNDWGIGQSGTAEPSGASGGGVVFVTSNWFAAYSTDGGNTFHQLDPTTIFPNNDAVGFCCDQIVQYAPSIDRFIWLLQGNGERLAVASPSDIISSKGTAWTAWNLTPDVFGESGHSHDYPDLALGNNNLYMSTDVSGEGRLVTRTSLAGLQAGGTIEIDFTNPSDSGSAWGGHLSQDTADEIFWAGQNSNSQMRIFSLKEGSNTYYWQDVGISSWANNSPLTSNTPDNQNWINFLFNPTTQNLGGGFPSNAVLGLTRSFNQVWFAWSAGTDNNFPRPHIEMVTLNIDGNQPPNLSVAQQVQIWNSAYTFAYPALATNLCSGEIGFSLEGGGDGNYENHSSASGETSSPTSPPRATWDRPASAIT